MVKGIKRAGKAYVSEMQAATDAGADAESAATAGFLGAVRAVSYTHLTLPTIPLV